MYKAGSFILGIFQDFGDEQYQDFLKQYESLYDLVDAIKDKLQFFDNGHTGNSMSMSWLLFPCSLVG